MEDRIQYSDIVIIGGGFTGLSAAYELAKGGAKVTILEAESEIGGLAGAFNVENEKLDKFYHHWFTNDLEVMALIKELDLEHKIEISPTNTGVYYANNFFKLSTPLDLIRFTPLSLINRIRLGLLALRARRVTDWKVLEDKTAKEWLKSLGGESVYRVVWEPLLKGKFGPYADQISAVWFWNKLKLRGGSRGRGGEERLAYFRGGFVALAETLADKIKSYGGTICLNSTATRVRKSEGSWLVDAHNTVYHAKSVLFTTALPIIGKLIEDWADRDYLKDLNRINYIGNICLVLQLNRSLSDTYWLNVNDPKFPFVGIIEHTNFEKPETYGGRHIVYLSKYLPHTDPLYSMDTEQFLSYSIPFIKEMFPQFERKWIIEANLWKARWSQPVVEKKYSELIPSEQGPLQGMFISSMAQIYPEDRGTNYAIREGRRMGRKILTLYSNDRASSS